MFYLHKFLIQNMMLIMKAAQTALQNPTQNDYTMKIENIF